MKKILVITVMSIFAASVAFAGEPVKAKKSVQKSYTGAKKAKTVKKK